MNHFTLCLLCLFTVVCFAGKKPVTTANAPLTGTWCTGEAGMLLTFTEPDTLTVQSTSDESMGGRGSYRHTDSTFSATLHNGDLTLGLKYRYRWKGTDTIEAKATVFTIDEEPVEVPEEWMSMWRCKEKK